MLAQPRRAATQGHARWRRGRHAHRRRRLRRRVRAPSPRRHRRRPSGRRALPPASTGCASASSPTSTHSRWSRPRTSTHAVDSLNASAPGPDRARRRLRDLGRPRRTSAGRRAAGAACGARTASSPSSATTTTTATCRRRWPRSGITGAARTSAHGSKIRGERLELAGIRFWTRKAADIARVLQGAARHGHPARARSAAADGSRGARRAGGAVRAHPWRPGGLARRGRDRRAASFRSSPGIGARRTHRRSS